MGGRRTTKDTGKKAKARGMLRRRAWASLLLAVLGVALVTLALQSWHGYTRFKNEPLVSSERVLLIEQGVGFNGIVDRLRSESARPHPRWYWRLLERELAIGRRLKAGEYQLRADMTPVDALRLLESGRVLQYRFTILEGSRFADVRRELRADPILLQTLDGLDETAILQRIGAVQTQAEGLFLPETYQFPRGFSDLQLLERAYWAMQRELEKQWAEREADLPLRNPYEALILASVVEKETGKIDEQPQVAGVFINRMRIGMRLQSDPTVIYGLGDAFDGTLRRVDLRTDTPYNSYTRAGLPPTPIALPGAAAIRAVLHPATTDAFYFVASGDGRHQFSRTLAEHNRAVARYRASLRQDR
jgi:UPF0755 protein